MALSALGMISPFLEAANRAINIKKTETVLPIAKKQAFVTPMVVGEDLALRSSVLSPAGYDRELIKLLHDHTEIVVDGVPTKLPYAQFCSQISNVDKTSLVWAFYKSTYETLGKKTLKCPIETCKYEFKEEFLLDQLVHEDTYTFWEDDKPFEEFRHVIQIEDGDSVYMFNTRFPSIQDNNATLGLVTIDILQKNIESIGTIFSKPQQMVLVIEAMKITSKSGAFDAATSNNPQEMLMAITNTINANIAEKFFKDYQNKFKDMSPKYYKNVTCPTCKHVFKSEVDLEIEFFRRSLYGSGESE